MDSEPKQFILLDSNVYFRLARSIHPLLKIPLTNNGPFLAVTSHLDQEYNRADERLKKKFFWVKEKRYSENRKDCFPLTRDQNNEIEITFYFMRETARDKKLSTSQVDIRILAHAYVLSIIIVSDDSDLLVLAKEYEVETLNSLELLNKMIEYKFTDIEKVIEIVEYWKYLCDCPKNYKADCKRLFGQVF